MGLLQQLGFDISEKEVTSPGPAACQILKERGLRPHLLIHDGKSSGPWDYKGSQDKMEAGKMDCTLTGPATGKDTEVIPGSCHGADGPWGIDLMGLPAGDELRPAPSSPQVVSHKVVSGQLQMVLREKLRMASPGLYQTKQPRSCLWDSVLVRVERWR